MNPGPCPGVGFGFHPIQKIPKRDFFGWCSGGCWVTEALETTMHLAWRMVSSDKRRIDLIPSKHQCGPGIEF